MTIGKGRPARRKSLALLLCSAMMAASFGAAQAASADSVNRIEAQFFVSTTGSDSNDGTYEHPFLTINKAQEAVRKINQEMTGDIQVFIAPGDYHVLSPLKFDERDSGSNGHRIHYRSMGAPGSSRLIGGESVAGGWEPTTAADAAGTDVLSGLPADAASKVYKVKLDPAKHDFNQLYIGAQKAGGFQKATMARTPNKVVDPKFQATNGPYFMSTGGSNKDMSYKPGDLTAAQLKGLTDAQGSGRAEIAQLYVFDAGGSAFESNVLPISRIDAANNKVFSPFDAAHPEMYITKYNINANGRYFLQGNIALLDAPGEYHYDKASGWLLYYPSEADGIANVEDMNKLDVVVPTTNEVIRLEGTDKPAIADWGNAPNPAKQVSNITFDGLTIEATESDNYIVDGWSYGETWYAGGTAIPFPPPEAAGSTQPYYSDYAVRPAYMHGGFTLINTNNITIQNTRITNMGLFGIAMWRDNTHNTFKNLAIDHTGMGGINTDGGYPGVGKYNNNHTFENLLIHHVGEVDAFGSGLQVMNTGFSTFKNLEIHNMPRRAISFVGQAQTMPSASPNFDPVTDVYNYGNRFEYIYVHDAEQDTAEDSAIFIGALFKGSDVKRKYGTNDPTKVTNPATNEPYGDLKANFFNQIVVSNVGSAPDVRDMNTVHGMDLAMGASGTHLSNIEGVNNQSANLRVEPTQNNDVFYVDNVNSDFPTSAYNPRLYYSFDNSKMQYERIGINRQDFPFTSELAQPAPPQKHENSYFSDDFEGGKLDTTRCSVEKGKPGISTAYTAEGPFNGHNSLFINGGAAGNTSGVAVGRTFENKLNKNVTAWFFDKRRDYANHDYGEGLNYSDVMTQSYLRADDNTAGNHVGLGVNGHLSKDYFSYLDGTTEKLTSIPRSFGWHKLELDYSVPGEVQLKINGQAVDTLPRESFNYIGMGNYNADGVPGTNTGMSYFDDLEVHGGVDAPAAQPLKSQPAAVPPYSPPAAPADPTLASWDFENGTMPVSEVASTGSGQAATFNSNGFTTFWGTNPNLKVAENPRQDATNGSSKAMLVNNESSQFYKAAAKDDWHDYTLSLKFALASNYTDTAHPLRFFVNTQPIVASGSQAGKMTYQPAGYNVAFNKANNKMELYRADQNADGTHTNSLIAGSTNVDLPAELFTAVTGAGGWHTLSITVGEGSVSATLDGAKTVTGVDSTYTKGFFGITPWDGNTAKFNLAVDDLQVRANEPNMVYDANLKLGNAKLNGDFNPSYTGYQASILDPAKPVTLTMPSSTSGATFAIAMNGKDITGQFEGTAPRELPLNYGPNTLEIAQTSKGGATTTYTVGIYKPYSSATVGALNPVSTAIATKPELPKAVDVTFDGGNVQLVPIRWQMLNNQVLSTPGTHTVKGTLVGMYGDVAIKVHVNGIASIGSLAPLATRTAVAPSLPTTVPAQTMADGVSGSAAIPLTFAELDPLLYSKPGTFIVVAQADGRSTTLLQVVTVTDTRNLVRIPAPAAISGVANGAPKTASGLGLPPTVGIATDAGSVSAKVAWDVAAAKYNPSVKAAKTFTVSGTVALPAGVENPDGVDLTTTITVSVEAGNNGNGKPRG